MKKLLGVLVVTILAGCAIGSSGIRTNYSSGAVLTARVGEPLITDVSEQAAVYAVLAFVPGSKFERQLIYGGAAGTVVKFTYREFGNDMARAAFTQELQYDLATSKEIAFKDWLLEVVDYSNRGVTAKVTGAAPAAGAAASGRLLPKGARCSQDASCASHDCTQMACR